MTKPSFPFPFLVLIVQLLYRNSNTDKSIEKKIEFCGKKLCDKLILMIFCGILQFWAKRTKVSSTKVCFPIFKPTKILPINLILKQVKLMAKVLATTLIFFYKQLGSDISPQSCLYF